MTHKSTWKRREREIAAFFGTVRTPLSGGNSGHGTRSDSLHKQFFVEAKYRAKQAVWSLFLETEELAAWEHKTPVLALCLKGQSGFLTVVHSDDLEDFCAEFLIARGFKVLTPKKSASNTKDE